MRGRDVWLWPWEGVELSGGMIWLMFCREPVVSTLRKYFRRRRMEGGGELGGFATIRVAGDVGAGPRPGRF